MKLVFLLQGNRYFIEHGGAWFRIDSRPDVDLALSTLALEVADEFELVEQPHQRGIARMLLRKAASNAPEAVDVLHFVFSEPDGNIVDTVVLPIDSSRLMHVEWVDRRFRDGWAPADLRLVVDGMSQLTWRVYLPPADGSTGKRLVIENETDGTTTEVLIPRDATIDLSLVDVSFTGKRKLRLRCDPEQIKGSTDARQLGFVMVEEIIKAA